ncbi:glycoside hydrolase family 2 TIM barrel-domain containing protein [Ruminococcus sp. Marseille-P328]|uniref:glycoside hydrolase family 2 TIM barrel-domain containing protein n=1 Tax=Ruminococcus sp. Marseille-P328 TaxID=1816688 RepID=UPI00356B3AD3
MKLSFNENWICYKTGEKEDAFAVTLPHDAMQLDERRETSAGGVNTGWYEAQDYTYEKTFTLPEEAKEEKVILEFEGVYRKATVYINDEKVAYHSYGYLGFYVDATKHVKFGEENVIRVEVINHDQPNSRWYSGTGIYRPVWLYTVPKKHLRFDSVKITTLDYKEPKIRVEAWPNEAGEVKVEILERKVNQGVSKTENEVDLADNIVAMEILQADGKCSCELALPGAKLWSPEAPNLYTCRVTFGDDVQEEAFGIRMVSCTPEKGLQINGKNVLLKGGCIHHDNGLLGACAYEFAERRKIRILLDAGYNAIRSAHNPCSKALLRACDEMGMLVMDEYIDGWYIHKTKYDYADEILDNYRKDLKDMVDKDYNHPSIIMYSTGNEVSETAQKKGIALTKSLTDRLHELDSTRPVSCGINIFFNFLSSMGFGVYSDKKADEAAENAKKKKAVGSEFYNTVAGIFGAGFMKTGATLYPCDVKTRDAYANMDVAGYNYGIKRYRHDLKKYPKRIILGSETFCADAYQFMQEAKRDKRIIGDFVWAAQDYLGEVGIGAWEYKDYAPRFDGGCGWVSAGSGRIDLTGKPLGEMAYTRVAFELEDLAIAVMPVDHTKDVHSPSAWKMTNAMESWSWDGCDGNAAKVEVYTRADHVKLYVNGDCVGTKKPKNDCKVFFDTTYHNGEIKAVAYDANGNVIAEKSLKTAGKETVLRAEPELTKVNADSDLCYVRMRYTDENGETKPLARGRIKLEVEGGELLAFGSACPYYPERYQSDETNTYYGEALAIIRPQAGAEKVVVKAQAKVGEAAAEVEILG